jgi:hypothetical protein
MIDDARDWPRLQTLAIACLLACCARDPKAADSPAVPAVAPGPGGAMSRSAPSARPALRRLLTAHPETVARQVPADNDARIRAYLAAHSDVPAEIAAALDAHELWAGMTQAEAELSVGPATRREATDAPNGFALFYAGEGWLLRFDGNGYLNALVER